MGSDYKLAKGLFSSARVLSSHVYLLFAEGISFDRAFSTATVLIVIVLVFNFAARRLIGRMGERYESPGSRMRERQRRRPNSTSRGSISGTGRRRP